MIRTGRRTAAGLVLLYVATAAATASWAPGRLRPLFDGFASHPGAYSWVKPPKEFAEGNRPPEPATSRVVFSGVEGSSPLVAETPDGQALASLEQGSVPPHPPDTAANVNLRPVDSATLGPLPVGLRPESNAYQVTLAYLPSAVQATALDKPGTVGLTSRTASDTLLFSADGRSWQPVTEAMPLRGGTGFTGPLTQFGYYLTASKGEPRPSASASDGRPPVALYLAAGFVPLVLGYLLLSKRGRPRRTTSTRGRLSPQPPRPASRPANRTKNTRKKK